MSGIKSRLEIVAVADEIVRARLDFEIAAFEIGDSIVDLEFALEGSRQQHFDRRRRAVQRSHTPILRSQIESVAAWSASQIQSVAGRKGASKSRHQRRGRLEKLLAAAVAMIPLVNAQMLTPPSAISPS